MPSAETLQLMRQRLAEMDANIAEARQESRRLRAAGLVDEANAVDRDLSILEGKGRQLRTAFGL